MLELIQRMGYFTQQVAWELTLACNMHCLHCASGAGDRRSDELSWNECVRVADELVELGCHKLCLSGGEPTLHPRWYELGRRMVEGGIGVHIISNAWNWGERETERAIEAGLENVGFSLDGLESAHDTVRRAGSFQRVITAVDHCVAAGIPVGVLTHLNRLNSRTLDELFALIHSHDVTFWQVQLGVPTGAMDAHRELVLPPEDLLWLVPELARLRQAQSPQVVVAENIGYYGIYEARIRDQGGRIPFWFGCRAGCHSIGIQSNGDIKGCLSLPDGGGFVEGNLRRESLPEIWQRPDAFALNRQFDEAQLGGFCASCRYRDLCRGGCSWTAYSHTGSCYDNPYCFYRQAVLHQRFDLLEKDEPALVSGATSKRLQRST